MFGEDVFSEYEEIVIVHTTNKECILICHGNNDIAYMEFEILWEALKNTKATIFWYAYITNGIKSKDRWLSLYIEK